MDVEVAKHEAVIVGEEGQLDLSWLGFGQINVRKMYRTNENKFPHRT